MSLVVLGAVLWDIFDDRKLIGDAFSAALIHGLTMKWDLDRVGAFANRLGALVASRHGAVPEWTVDEITE